MNYISLKPLALAVSIAMLATACGQQANSVDNQAAAAATAPAAEQSAAVAKPAPAAAASVFKVSELDPAIQACQDFNGFVNEKWVKANPIPSDRTRWGSFDELREKSLTAQHELVKKAAADAASAPSDSIEQKIGWLWQSGMDQAAVDKAGYDPIKPELASIAALKNRQDIVNWLQKSFARGDGRVFSFGSSADYKNAKLQIAFTFQSGLSLPTPKYYLKDDKDSKKLRDEYVAHVAKLFELTGVSADEAKKKADHVLAFETRLARHSIPRVELRDPKNQYKFVTVAEADKVTPHFDWSKFFASQGVTVDKGFSMGQPKFFAEFDKMLVDVPVAQWQDYLAAHTIASAAPYLSRPFVDESFAFNGKTLNGQPEQKPRWKRVLSSVNGAMGQALGQLYVARYFPPEAKERADQLVKNVLAALKQRIENLAWMSPETKQKALEKWSKFLPKIGYPEEWRSWQGLQISPDNYYANLEAAQKFNHDYDIAKIGKPTDRKEWGMTPQTVNAYYNPSDNTINFPAAILQPPFFYAHGDDAINYGGIGAVIGHEASHGFDDQGSQFDGNGNLDNWWTKTDREKFDARTKKLVDQFNGYAPLADHPDKHVDGQLTLGENIADLGGLNIAYDALQMALENHPQEVNEKIDGYTEDQRFFMNWARVWRGNIREKRQLVLLNVDPHAPAKFRAIGAPSNMPTFAQAFQCKAGDEMVRPDDKQVNIW